LKVLFYLFQLREHAVPEHVFASYQNVRLGQVLARFLDGVSVATKNGP
jgi:hypothetical protein